VDAALMKTLPQLTPLPLGFKSQKPHGAAGQLLSCRRGLTVPSDSPVREGDSSYKSSIKKIV